MLTLHFVDDTHLLLTFSLRNLVPRLQDDPVDDDDRLVAAEIVDLPSGRIAARTEWHMHDHGRYLWSLGRGRFLVRIGDRLSSMDLRSNLGGTEPFRRVSLPGQDYAANAVFVSPDGGLITVETVVTYVNPDGRAAALLGDFNAAKPQERTLIHFFRVEDPAGAGSSEEPKSRRGSEAEALLRLVPAGSLTSERPVILPLDSDGYLGAEPMGRNQWAIRFDEFGGKTVEVAKIESTCRPRPQMVSRSEFVAFPCHGSVDNVRLASYGLDGRETWEEAMVDLGAPVFAFAPGGARFALSHTIAPGTAPGAALAQDEPEQPRQEVRVYQNASGELLLRVECTPAFKTAENFDLSPDGLLATVVRNGAIAVFKLPPLEKGDREDMEDVARFAPPVDRGPVNLDALARRMAASESAHGGSAVADASAAPASQPAGAAALSPSAGASAASPPGAVETTAGSAASAPSPAPALSPAAGAVPTAAAQSLATPLATTRRAPTLLNPGEKPEFGSANNDQSEQSGATPSTDQPH